MDAREPWQRIVPVEEIDQTGRLIGIEQQMSAVLFQH